MPLPSIRKTEKCQGVAAKPTESTVHIDVNDRHIGVKRKYLPLRKVADTSFNTNVTYVP